ncbi:aldehyde dehydrogenase [Rhodococcus sp. ABRD24]|uniref:aldehyde dehydrogenase family protein n=1 Tax=Rhodococcus sp. ABRD24 TaxID=2507582 RepID=UPI00103BDE37|nr:aldehyde dehydrogenase family protein [Rhodococcus sp. ABRD24]QBJ95894.1 aldehyde dehydrogenase [Rhodococcus sp. ABRD24]
MEFLRNLIAGVWTESCADSYSDLVNPATEEVVARYPAGASEDVDLAVAGAAVAQRSWAALPVEKRVREITEWARAIADQADALAWAEYLEMGRPPEVGRTAIIRAANAFETSAAQALTYEFESVIADGDGETRILRRPVGVVALIAPWNYPLAGVLSTLGPLLAAGNSVVIKPSEKSPLSAVRLLDRSPLPPGVVSLVLGDSRAGAPLVEHPDIGLVHFTGSVDTGRRVGASAGAALRRTILELGGKDPVIVDSDVDPVTTAAAVARGAFMNTGQLCTSMERIYVHSDIATRFVDELVQAAAQYRITESSSGSTELGPLIDQRQRNLVHEHVMDAVERGATVLTGGTVPEGPGFYYPATVLTNVDETMSVMTEETFGPVAPVKVVSTFEEALECAAKSHYGLGATVYTNNAEHAEAAATLPAGQIWINQWRGGGPNSIHEPAKNSGMGATGSHATYDAATRPTSVYRPTLRS